MPASIRPPGTRFGTISSSRPAVKMIAVTMITGRGPRRSAIAPAKGWAKPQTMFCSAIEKPNAAAVMPSSAPIGRMNSPRLWRSPMQTEMISPERTMSSSSGRGRCMSMPGLLDLDREGARRLRDELEREVYPADLAPVGRLDLHLPVPGLVARLEAVAAEAFGAAADDLDWNRVLQHPAVLLAVPGHANLVGEARRREDAEEDEHAIALLRAEALIAVVPDAPRRALVREPVLLAAPLHRVIHADEGNRQRHGWDHAQEISAEKDRQHHAEGHEDLVAHARQALGRAAPDPPRERDHRHAADGDRDEEDVDADAAEHDRHHVRAEGEAADAEQRELEGEAQPAERPELVGEQQRHHHQHESERDQQRRALEEEDRVEIEQRAQAEAQDRGAIAGLRRVVRREEHPGQDRGDDGEVDRLLDDHVPRIDAADRDQVEGEAEDEEQAGDAALVLVVVEPEPLDRAQ